MRSRCSSPHMDVTLKVTIVLAVILVLDGTSSKELEFERHKQQYLNGGQTQHRA